MQTSGEDRPELKQLEPPLSSLTPSAPRPISQTLELCHLTPCEVSLWSPLYVLLARSPHCVLTAHQTPLPLLSFLSCLGSTHHQHFCFLETLTPMPTSPVVVPAWQNASHHLLLACPKQAHTALRCQAGSFPPNSWSQRDTHCCPTSHSACLPLPHCPLPAVLLKFQFV